MKPLISIIIPIYNVEKYLEKCLTSVIQQPYQNLQIICVNDGSTDGSLSIVEAYQKQDPRIEIISQKNAGLSAARNTGLKFVKGEYICFLDSDDYLEAGCFNGVLNLFEDEQVDWVCYGCDKFEDGNASKTILNQYSKDRVVATKSDDALSMRASAWGKIYRTSFIEKNNLRFQEGLFFEDIYFHWACISLGRKVGLSSIVMYNYLVRSNSIMGLTFQRKPGMAIHYLYNLEKIYELWRENGFLNQNMLLFVQLFENFTRDGFGYVCEQDKLEYLKRVHEDVQKWDLPIRKWTATYDMVYRNGRLKNKNIYKWVHSVRKRFPNLI